MVCDEHNSPSSVLSPCLIDIDFPDPAALASTDEGIDNPAHMNKLLASSPLQSSSLKRTLSASSNSSPNDGATRSISKRRRKSRAKPKVPVTQLSANKLNFRDIVHQFTGNDNLPPSSSADIPRASASACSMPAEDGGSAQSHVLLAVAGVAQSLGILYTICGHFLQDGSTPKKLQSQLQKSCKSLSFLQELISESQAPTRNIASGGLGRVSHEMAFQNQATGDLNPVSASHGLQQIFPNEEMESKRELDVDLQHKAQELEEFLLSGDDLQPAFFSCC